MIIIHAMNALTRLVEEGLERLRIALVIALVFSLQLSATEPNPSPRQRELVEKLLVLMKMDGMMTEMIDSTLALYQKQMNGQLDLDGGEPAQRQEANELFDRLREHASRIDVSAELREEFIRMYSRHFTESELRELVEFYSTPIGQKTIEVMPKLAADGMDAGAKHLGPKMEQAFKAALEDVEAKRPWRRTMSDIRSVATAVEAWAIDNDRYPEGDYAKLKELLAPTYLREFPEKDIWGHAYAYVVSLDGQRYRLASAGSDGIFDWDTRRIGNEIEDEDFETRYRERLEDDVIFEDGQFLQAPVQAREEYR
jgi:hypothetical protein